MFYIFEPQKDVSDDRAQTWFVPCPVGEAEIFAVFTKEHASDDEADYIGDVPVAAVMRLVRKAQSREA